MIRSYGELDYLKVKTIWEKYYASEFDVDDLNCFAKAVVGHFDSKFNKREITGFGLIKSVPEAIMLLDKSNNNYTRGKDLIDLLHHATLACAIEGYDRLYTFVQDEEFSKLLQEHFNFKKIIGDSLILTFDK